MMLRSVSSIVAVVFLTLIANPGARAEVVIETVTVGNPGNAGELSGAGAGGSGPNRICGAVDYIYNIGKFEVTAGQYTEFLNAVAATDTYELYSQLMVAPPFGCNIQRSGSPGNYSYTVAPDWAGRPVNYVSWGDAARFCNWLHNAQPTGAQDLTTTEDGSYYLNGATSNAALMAVVRNEGATWFIPSEDEWYKAAYHYNDGVTGNYFDYPTSSDSVPNYIGDGESIPDPDPGNYATYNGDGGIAGIGPPYYRTEVGEHENSASPYGTFDQGGNLWEWNEAVTADSYRGTRGGSFYGGRISMSAAYRHNHLHPSSDGYYLGFRVAKIAEPVPECGNGAIEDSEECDDGNAADGDGCSSTCTVEDGWNCTGEPSVCTPAAIPVVSEWGLVAMTLLLLTGVKIAHMRKRQAA